MFWTANFKEVKKMMERNYEYLVAEYARTLSNLKYLVVLKNLDSEIYKSNRDNIDNKIEELEIESERLLTELEKLFNEKEPV
jgi:hypothetical protein